MRVLFVTSEINPISKSGGLADFSQYLPQALERGEATTEREKIDIRVLTPAYSGSIEKLHKTKTIVEVNNFHSFGSFKIVSGYAQGSEVPIWLVDCPRLFHREGYYQNDQGYDWDDNCERFCLLSHVAYYLTLASQLHWKPDLVHCNDWHTGLIPALFHYKEIDVPTVFTFHNLVFQGTYNFDQFSWTGLPEEAKGYDGIEYYGGFSLLKAGLQFGTYLTTVSPHYAREVTFDGKGYGLEGVIRKRQSSNYQGILNGVDSGKWNPSCSKLMNYPYDQDHLSEKIKNKLALQKKYGFKEGENLPVLAFVGRLIDMKGISFLLKAIYEFVQIEAQFVIAGYGAAEHLPEFYALKEDYPQYFQIMTGCDQDEIRSVFAASDLLLLPSKTEPAGLTSMNAMRYGVVPVVYPTGALVDLVLPFSSKSLAEGIASGFVFSDYSYESFSQSIKEALFVFQDPFRWKKLQKSIMKRRFSWELTAEKYADIFCSLVKK